MSPRSLRLGPLPLLGLVNLLFAAGLAWLWVDEHAHPRNLTWVTPKALAPDIKLPVISGLPGTAAANPTALQVILDRPVFAPDRRPPPPPPPPTPTPPPDPLADIHIYGIFSGTTAGVLARVDGKMRRIKINESLGAWKLKGIEGRDATFTQGEKSRTLHIANAQLNTAPSAPQANAANANPAQVTAPPVPLPAAAPGAANTTQKIEDENRELLRRRNALRASRGLPPLTQ